MLGLRYTHRLSSVPAQCIVQVARWHMAVGCGSAKASLPATCMNRSSCISLTAVSDCRRGLNLHKFFPDSSGYQYNDTLNYNYSCSRTTALYVSLEACQCRVCESTFIQHQCARVVAALQGMRPLVPHSRARPPRLRIRASPARARSEWSLPTTRSFRREPPLARQRWKALARTPRAHRSPSCGNYTLAYPRAAERRSYAARAQVCPTRSARR